MYPVGSIYLSVNNVNPGTIFGGTWEQIQDRFLLAAGSTYGGGSTGGSANHTHTSAAHTHTTAGHTLTVNEIPSHRHQLVRQQWYSADNVRSASTNAIYSWKGGEGTGGSTSKSWTDPNSLDILSTGGGASHSHGDTGSTIPGNTGSSSSLPPYLAIYAWKRTA